MAGSAEYAVKMVISALDRASAPFRAVEARMVAAREKMSDLSRTAGLNRVTASVGRLGNAFGGVVSQLRSMAGPMLAIAGIGGIMGFGALLNHTMSLGDSLDKLKIRTGMGVESLQGWAYAADMAGVSNEEWTAGLEAFNKNIGDTANKVGKAQKVFKALGISIREPNGALKDNEKLLREVQGKLHKLKDPAMRAAVTSKLFGDSTGKLAGFLSQETSEIDKLIERKGKLGNLNDDDTSASATFNDALVDLNTAFMGIANTLMAKVFPVLEPFVKKMTEAIEAHRSEIVAKFTGFLERMAKKLEQINFDDVIKDIEGFFGKIETAIGWIGGFENAFYLLVAVMAGPLLAAVASATSAVISLGVALMTTPVGWIIAAVAAIAGAVYLIYDNWESISTWFGELWDGISASMGNFAKEVVSLFLRFNPFTGWALAINDLVNYLFGIDIGGYLAKQFDSLTASLPDWAQGWFDGGETAKPPPTQTAATTADGMGAPSTTMAARPGNPSAPMMAMSPPVMAGAQKVAVESKGEMRVKLDLPPGMTAAVVGEKSSGPTDFALDTGRSSMP